MLTKIQTFLKSLFWHVYSGMPKSSQAQIDYRLKICLSCYDYDEKNKECGLCGCNVNNRRIFMNKLAWADQKCPKGEW